MKLYGNNRRLVEHLLEAAFALLRNEGLQPADCLALAYRLLAGGVDVSPAQRAALQGFLACALSGPSVLATPPVETSTRGNTR